jgi:anthranilate phosphoribosyltransferase
MKSILNQLYQHNTLSKAEAKELLGEIAQGKHNPSQVASFVTVFNMRSITVPELEGFRDAMLELCVPVDLKDFDPIDLCGTGGDGKNTFNVSTLASFVAAGAGLKVAKHGNYGVSSVSGSSNVMEHLGYTFTNKESLLQKQMDEAGICFLHAPLFHPAMKNVAPIRRELGLKTFFNMIGPMVNPAFPNKQLVGVFSLELARLYYYLYQKTDKRFTIVHSLDGYDEFSLTSACKVATQEGEALLSPEGLGLPKLRPEMLFGGNSVEDAAKIFVNVLEGKGTEAQEAVVIANAALAIRVVRHSLSTAEALQVAGESLESGKALQAFKRLLSLSEAVFS